MAVGRALNAAARVADRTRRQAPTPPALSPAERHELVQRQMAERLAALAGEARRSS